ncbi:MAG: hypothetical protein PHO02_00465 [Candidatus Nanoarchaeia archaeon]|nr:hypothetical protein [Candidatus Nanoarchaeia archaeon]
MAIAGINFDKILVEKLKKIEAPLKINSNISLSDVTKEKDSEKGMALLRFDFVFGLDYAVKQAVIEIKGHVLVKDKEKEIDDILSVWKKTKKISPALAERVLNVILLKCNIKALLLSQEFNLPPHIQFPTLANKPSKYHG